MLRERDGKFLTSTLAKKGAVLFLGEKVRGAVPKTRGIVGLRTRLIMMVVIILLTLSYRGRLSSQQQKLHTQASTKQ